jgi:hypothetical protein
MTSTIRRILATGLRVLGFCRSHPFANVRYNAAMDVLEERLNRANLLDSQHWAGRSTVSQMSVAKAELRNTILTRYLRPLALISRAIAAEQPGLLRRFQAPQYNANKQEFLTLARSMMAEATLHRELFLSFGLGESFFEDLAKALDAYDDAEDGGNAGRTSHVGARADLIGVAREIMGLIRQLDAINRYRFLNDRELSAAWKSAREVAWPLVTTPEPDLDAPPELPGADARPAA